MVNTDRDRLDTALSAVMDGLATSADWRLVEAAWAQDPALRERWSLWQLVGDGLRSAELPAAHRDGEALLRVLHARMPQQGTAAAQPGPTRRGWLAPLAVAAGFVALTVGVVTLRPVPSHAPQVAAAPVVMAVPSQGLVGASFAQTATGRTLAAYPGVREVGLQADAPPEIAGWGPVLPPPSALRPGS